MYRYSSTDTRCTTINLNIVKCFNGSLSYNNVQLHVRYIAVRMEIGMPVPALVPLTFFQSKCLEELAFTSFRSDLHL
jgi:hypothetical protein